jgi:co-chaperonin GroES (HSP10)
MKRKTKKAKPISFRPLGARVMVLFPQADWEVGEGGFITRTGIVGSSFRMDGLVVAVGTHDIPDNIGVGSTVYADPRVGDIIKIDGTRYHLMKCTDLMAVAEGN